MIIDKVTGAAILEINSKTYGKFGPLVDVEDYPRIIKHVWHLMSNKAIQKAGRFYFATDIKQPDGTYKKTSLHRFIMGDIPEGYEVDHLFHNYLDCRKSQLRIVTRSENSQNSRKKKGASSRFKGVSISKRDGKYAAQIMHNGRTIHIGYFPLTPKGELEAARAYDRKARELGGNYLLNFPDAPEPRFSEYGQYMFPFAA